MKSIYIKPFFVLLLTLLMTACGGSSGSNDVTTNPTIGAKLTVSFTNDQNQAITTSEATDAVFVNVTATNDFGRVASNVTVTFATDLGSLSQDSALTNSSGIASVRLVTTSTQLGVAGITTAGTVDTKALTATGQLAITDKLTDTTSLNVSLLDETCTNSVTTVQAGVTLCVKASLFTGTTAIEGKIVDFTVTQGSLRPASALTDASGVATTYIDSTEAMLGASALSATYLTQSATVNYQYTSVPNQSPTVSLTLLDDNCATQVNSIEAGSTFCLKAGLIQNGQPIAGEIVSFASPIGTLRQSTVLTESDGFAITYLDSTSAITGAASATASFGSFSAVQNYQFTALSPNSNTNVSLSVLDDTCTNALNSVSAGSSLCLQASLIRQNSPVGNAIITFAAPLGSLRQTTALTNSNGVASILLDSVTTVLGAAIATASFESVSASQNYQFTDTPSLQSTRLTMDIRDSGCQALTNNTSAGTPLCLILTLTKGDTPQANELINFAAPLGTLSQSSTLTDEDGIAVVLLNSTDTEVGAATVTASFNEFALGRNYEFTKANPLQQTSLALVVYDQSCTTPTTVTLAGDTLCIKADLTFGDTGIEDEIVQFSATLGTLETATGLTDINGSTSVLLTSTAAQLGAATITAVVASKGLNASKNYQLIGSNSSSTLTLSTRGDDCLEASNSFSSGSTFCLVAEMLDEGTPVADQIISFTSPIGLLRQATALTNSLGLASVLVDIGATELGAAMAVADHANLSSTANYEVITGGPQTTLGPHLELVTVQNGVFKNRFKAGESIQLQAKLLDANDQPIQTETVVRFTVERGQLNTDSSLTDSVTGFAEVILTAGVTDIGAAVATAQAVVNGVTYPQTFNYQILSPDAVEDEIPSIGYFDDSETFIKNEIELSLTPDASGKYDLSAGGTIGLKIFVVNQRNERIISPTPVTFSSACADNNKANLDTQVTTINGLAQSTYEDVSCATVNGNQDTLTASVTINNVSLTATATIKLLPEDVGSIEFISAEPTNIVLRGTGGQGKQETSTLTFLIKGVLGNPLTQQPVTFDLDTEVGGLSIYPESSLTNSQGLVTTRVTAGNVPAAVRVTAATIGQDPVTNEDKVIRTQSDLLSANTGLPDQNSITLTTANLNPESHNLTGVEVILTAYMADSFNNPVPDGTTVNFTTEGGFIQPTCNTTNGSCNVTWTGTNPRVPNHRITVLATAIGHETFFDFNGNNVFDDDDDGGDPNTAAINEGTDSGLSRSSYFPSGFIDHSEAWRDDDENRVHDGGELFIDYNNDQTFNSADGLFNGPHCQHESLCGAQAASKINVRKALIMIMSGSNPIFTLMTTDRTSTSNSNIEHIDPAYVLSTNDTETGVVVDGGITIDDLGINPNTDGIIVLDEGRSVQLVLTMADDALGLGQALPASTEVGITTSFGSISGTSVFSTANTVGYLNTTGDDEYGGTSISFGLVNTNSTSNVGDTTQSGLMTFSFSLPSSNTVISYSMPFRMIGR